MATAFVVAVAAGDLTLYPLIHLRAATLVPVAVAVVALWVARHASWRRSPPASLLLLAAVVAIWVPTALLRAPDPVAGRAEAQGLVAGVAVAVGVVALTRGSAWGLSAVRRGWSLALLLSVVVGTIELVTHRHLWVGGGLAWAEAERTILAGAFRNPNDFAIALTAMISGTLADAASRRSPWRGALFALVVLGAIGVALTESRSGMLTLLVVLAAHAWSALRRRGTTIPRRTAVVLATGVGALLAASFLVPALAARNPVLRAFVATTQPGTARSDELRLDLIRAALRYLRASDGLGTGAASFEVLLMNDPAPGVAMRTWLHNSFVEIVLQYGVVVAAALGLVMIAVIAALFPRPRWASSSTARVEGAGALVAYVALGCAAASAVTTPIWWLMLGQAVASTWWLSARPAPLELPGAVRRGSRPGATTATT